MVIIPLNIAEKCCNNCSLTIVDGLLFLIFPATNNVRFVTNNYFLLYSTQKHFAGKMMVRNQRSFNWEKSLCIPETICYCLARNGITEENVDDPNKWINLKNGVIVSLSIEEGSIRVK